MCDTRDIYNVTKYLFKINLFELSIHQDSQKEMSLFQNL